MTRASRRSVKFGNCVEGNTQSYCAYAPRPPLAPAGAGTPGLARIRRAQGDAGPHSGLSRGRDVERRARSRKPQGLSRRERAPDGETLRLSPIGAEELPGRRSCGACVNRHVPPSCRSNIPERYRSGPAGYFGGTPLALPEFSAAIAGNVHVLPGNEACAVQGRNRAKPLSPDFVEALKNHAEGLCGIR